MKQIYMVSLALSVALSAGAVPAKPGLGRVLQPDGTSVAARLIGDENHHVWLSEDGYPLAQIGDTWFFCTVDADGKLVSSGFKAGIPAHRDTGTSAFLESLDKYEMMQRLTARAVNSREDRVCVPRAKGPGLFPNASYPTKGSPKALVLLVEFSDTPMRTESPGAYFGGLLNQRGFSDWNATGSARDFFEECSDGLFKPEFDVYGPVRLPNECAYYGGNDQYDRDLRPYQMLIDACQLLDSQIDFSRYDCDSDGFIDNVFVFYAGRGEASGGGSETIWPHAGYVEAMCPCGQPHVFDGVRLDRYACTNEWGVDDKGAYRPDGIGTFVHEFSHVLGLPDLYATSYTGAFTPGSWSTMDVGPYNNDGRTPPCMTAFERYALDWLTPVDVSAGMDVGLRPISENCAAIIPTSRPEEFFLLENRQQTGWDKFIPGHGMLVWHVDYNSSIWSQNIVNNDNIHQYVDIEEADDWKSEQTRDGDAFPGTSGKDSFTDDTSPSMREWSGRRLECPVTDIREADGMISFRVKEGGGNVSRPGILPPEECGDHGFTARWTPVEGKAHFLSVYSKDVRGNHEYAEGYAMREVTGADRCAVEGLDAGKIYYYSVRCLDGVALGESSDEALLFTGADALSHFTVESCPAEEIGHDSFVAVWKPLFGSSSYLLSVSKVTGYGDDFTDSNNFDGGLDGMGQGWNYDNASDCTLTPYVGIASPSAKLSSGGYVESPLYKGLVSSVAFWHRGNGTPEGAVVVVEAKTAAGWVPVADIPVATAAGGVTVTVDSFGETHAFRISLESPTGKGSVSIDDIQVTGTGDMNTEPVGEYMAFNVGDVVRHKVAGLSPSTEYIYSVCGTDGSLVSLPSAKVKVATQQNSGCDSVLSDAGMSVSRLGNDIRVDGCEGEVMVLDVAGIVVARGRAGESITLPSRGIYIVTAAGKVARIAL